MSEFFDKHRKAIAEMGIETEDLVQTDAKHYRNILKQTLTIVDNLPPKHERPVSTK